MHMNDVPYGVHPEQVLDIRVNTAANKTVVYIHGGGLTEGQNKTYAASFLDALEHAGYSVIAVEYRLYPKAKFPEFIHDCALALAFVKNNAQKYGYSADISVFGNSAGAYISAMLLFDTRFLSLYGLTRNDFTAFILNSPQPTTHFNVLKEQGIDPAAVHIDEASPLYFLKKGEAFPKLLLVTYLDDLPGRKEQNMMFSKTLELFGVEHTFEILAGEHCSGETHDADGTIRMLPLMQALLQ